MWCFDHVSPASTWYWDLGGSYCYTSPSVHLPHWQFHLTQWVQLELDGCICMHVCTWYVYHVPETCFELDECMCVCTTYVHVWRYFVGPVQQWILILYDSPGDARKVAICWPPPLHTISFAPSCPGSTYSSGSARTRILLSTSAKGVDGPTSTVNNIPGSVTCQVTCPKDSSEHLMQFLTPGVMNIKVGSLLVIVKLTPQPISCWASPTCPPKQWHGIKERIDLPQNNGHIYLAN